MWLTRANEIWIWIIPIKLHTPSLKNRVIINAHSSIGVGCGKPLVGSWIQISYTLTQDNTHTPWVTWWIVVFSGSQLLALMTGLEQLSPKPLTRLYSAGSRRSSPDLSGKPRGFFDVIRNSRLKYVPCFKSIIVGS